MTAPRLVTSSSSGMGYERKKRTLSAFPASQSAMASSSSSAFYRHAFQDHPPPSPSPPASTYFPHLAADTSARLRPTPDAESHFAYSTTLRRHHSEGSALTRPSELASALNAEASSLWSRTVGYVTGQPSSDPQSLESGRGTPSVVRREEPKDTVSARFAHYSVEVRCLTSTRPAVFFARIQCFR